MNIFIWLLTFALVIDCLVLILLVLIQLPKKEAGMGQAFGGGATDALFGAGSGNALTKMTKYTAGIFFVLTLLISVLFGKQTRTGGVDPRAVWEWGFIERVSTGLANLRDFDDGAGSQFLEVASRCLVDPT